MSRLEDNYSLENVAHRLEGESQREEAEAEAGNFREVLGESFTPYDCESNYERIGRFCESMHWPISARSLLGAFAILASRGVLEKIPDTSKPEEPAPAPVEQPRDEKGRYTSSDPEAEFLKFYYGATAVKIKARLQTDPAFERWLRAQIQANTAHREPPREPIPPVVLPESPPAELKEFAARWHRMAASEVRKNLTDANFVRAMDSAAAAGLI